MTLHTVTVACHADSIPEELVVDLTGLEIGDAVRVSDLKFPAKVEAAMDANAAVATIVVASSMADVTMPPMSATAEAAVADADAESAAKPKGGEELVLAAPVFDRSVWACLLVAGLGNPPGPPTRRTAHNIGFMAVDALARRWEASRPGAARSRFHAAVPRAPFLDTPDGPVHAP